MIIVLMGVSGSGKTTIGQVLGAKLGWRFLDADYFHPAANIEKMHRGEPLTDEDRLPWLRALRQQIDDAFAKGENIVLACSALKHAYRDYLDDDVPADAVHFVYLEGSEELIAERLVKRTGHFMPPGLLHSQFMTLEPPDAVEHALRVDIAPPPEVVADNIITGLKLR